MLLLPIGFLKVFHRWPTANLFLIAGCVVGTLLCWTVSPWLHQAMAFVSVDYQPSFFDEYARPIVSWLSRPWMLITYPFFDPRLFRLIGNMVFLFVFGSALDAELGHLRFLLFMGLSAVVCALTYELATAGILSGASGPICAVTALAAVLYPRNDVRIFWMFGARMGVFETTALAIVAVWFVFDVGFFLMFSALGGSSYAAHVAGSAFGALAGVAALKLGWVESDGHDFLTHYLGIRAKRTAKARFAPLTVKKADIDLTPRKPTDDWSPIPLDLAETVPVPAVIAQLDHGDWSKEKKTPSYKELDQFFRQRSDMSDVSAEQHQQLREWYAEYRKIHAGVKLEVKTLLGLARCFRQQPAVDEALDAYDRLLRLPLGDKQGPAALEATQAAVKFGKLARARVWLRKAQDSKLSPAQMETAERLQAEVGDT